ncbi:hypothetical protein KJ641_04315 [Patescibacteria group bacterium]|nr:hypothetical protein [Patescibacteria group bacterium]
MKLARANGMTTMMEDGVYKVLSGETTLEEVLRVTAECKVVFFGNIDENYILM